MSVLSFPYMLDRLNYVASVETNELNEARNWITNAKKCGWHGLVEQVEEQCIVDGNNADVNGCDVDADTSTGKFEEATDDTGQAEFHYPSIMTKSQIRSSRDDKYLQETLLNNDYWLLVGELTPNPKFCVPVRKIMFLLIFTSITCGWAYALGIPFLPI